MAGVLSTTRKASCFLGHLPHRNKITKGAVTNPQVIPIFTRCKSFSFSDPTPGEDYQHIMKSPIPTLYFQSSLPRLPIPQLKDTCARYLRAQRPLLGPYSYKQTEAFVESFLIGDGLECHNALLKDDARNQHTSYISRVWSEMYLSDRKPLPINYNPFLVFVNDNVPTYNKQVIKASNLVISSLRFYRSLDEELIEPEVYHMNPKKTDTALFRKFTGALPESLRWYGAYLFKAFPLDMSQYKRLFMTTRIPQTRKDSLKYVLKRQHLTVMRRGHFYVFDVLDENGDIVGPDVILSSLEYILSLNEEPAKYPLGVMTTENRDVWAHARKYLESLGNENALDFIDTSIFLLVLDDERPGNDPVSLVRCFLHADGVNRWFDKSLSLIVTADGTAGVNFEHSWGDGVAVLRYFNDVHNDMLKKPRVHFDTLRTKSVSVRKLEFKMDAKVKMLIDDAKEKYKKTCKSLEVRAMDYREFGRSRCKPLNISPDAMMQLAFQMAYDLIEGKQVATYESCSTAAFKHGRTETVRPCTLETQALCKALRSSESVINRAKLQELLVACSRVHSKLIKEAAMGQGFDRHLFALKLQADILKLKPGLFNDPAYAAINHNILSTSTLASDSLMLGAFGPVVDNGFGISYSLWNDRLGSIVTNYAGRANGSGFVTALQQSLDKIHYILTP